MSNPTQTITLTAQEGLGLVNTLLPILESAVPALGAAAGPIGLGVSAAIALTPVVIRLINRLAAAGVIDAATQQAQLERVASVLDFTADTWVNPIAPGLPAATPPVAGWTSVMPPSLSPNP